MHDVVADDPRVHLVVDQNLPRAVERARDDDHCGNARTANRRPPPAARRPRLPPRRRTARCSRAFFVHPPALPVAGRDEQRDATIVANVGNIRGHPVSPRRLTLAAAPWFRLASRALPRTSGDTLPSIMRIVVICGLAAVVTALVLRPCSS